MTGSGDGSELWRFATAAGGAVCTAAILFAGLPLGGGFLGFAVFSGVVAFAAREPAPRPLGLANRLTLVRLAALAALAGGGLAATFSSEAGLALAGWMPCLIYAAAALADYADGAIARRTGTTSAFGARLDAEADALGLAAASGIAVFASGTLPAWYLLAGCGRYLFGAALFVERRLGRRLVELPASPFRRRLAGFQMGLVAVCLAPFIEPEWAPPATLALGLPFLVGFARDYLIGTGRLDPESARSRRLTRVFGRLRRPVSRVAALAAVALGVLKLAGLAVGSWGLAAFFFGWLVRPGKRPAPGPPMLGSAKSQSG
ncbi:MAG: CDP-alcohol phosphatidyltransferase family protein [Acidobacteriota bacterium]|nr:CDP-alcohol phosphatidyltransferase family protein [Acidobacteriota bacterium]